MKNLFFSLLLLLSMVATPTISADTEQKAPAAETNSAMAKDTTPASDEDEDEDEDEDFDFSEEEIIIS